jgi:lysophospholipase L1-like esterase
MDGGWNSTLTLRQRRAKPRQYKKVYKLRKIRGQYRRQITFLWRQAIMNAIVPTLFDLARRATRALAATSRTLNHSRRNFLLAGALTAATVSMSVAPAGAADLGRWDTQNWVGAWSTAPAGPPLTAALRQFNNQTLRLIVHTTMGGTTVRIKLSNAYGTTPLRIGAAHVALRQAGGNIVVGSDRPVTFSGFGSITIPVGAPALSDPVELNVPVHSDLAVSLFLPEGTPANTIHSTAFQTNYISTAGDYTATPVMPIQGTLTSWPFLTGVDVQGHTLSASIVALGDSITDGSNTTVDANHRWTDFLSVRLQTEQLPLHPFGGAIRYMFPNLLGNTSWLSVLNKGIGGNRLLRDPGEEPLFGRAALARFDRDVLAPPAVEYMIVLIGINDIGHPGTGTIPAAQEPTVNDMIAGYRQLIARAHAKGITAFGGTLTPFEGTIFPGYYSASKEAIRVAVNQWIRTSGEFDAVIDFEAAVRDPAHPTRMLPAFDSGDHLHPNDAGMQAMANAIPLDIFRNNGFARLREALRR